MESKTDGEVREDLLLSESIEPKVGVSSNIIGEAGKLRLISFVLDNFIGWVSGIVFAKLFLSENFIINALLLGFGYLFYFVVFEALFSATIGKYLMGIEVRTVQGGKCGIGAILLRNVMRIIDANPLLFGSYPAGIAIFFSKRRQRWGDMVANTIVVRRNTSR